MMAQAFQNKEVGMVAGRKTLEINPNHTVVNDLLFKVKAEKGNVAAMDSAQVLSQTALVESGHEIADRSALVSRVYKLVSKELGVDPDAHLQEIELPEDEDPHGALDLMDHCMVAMNAQPVPGHEEQKGFSGHIGECALEQPASAEARPEVQESSSKMDEARQEENTKTQWRDGADLRQSGGRQTVALDVALNDKVKDVEGRIENTMCCSADDVHVSSEEHVLKDSDEMGACGIEETQRVRGGGVHKLSKQIKQSRDQQLEEQAGEEQL